MIQYMSVIDCRNSNADDDPERGHMKIDETVYIADGAKLIGDDIQVGNNCIIGAGSLVTEGTVIPDGYMAFGRPAKIVKKLTIRDGHNILLSQYDHLAKKCWFPSDLVAKVTFYPLRMCKSLETQLLPRAYFQSLIRIPFEFIHVPVPKEYDKVLRVYYGENYMEPVKSGGEHGEVIFNPERPYTEVIREL